jgi:aldehyde dehydrogenase (NAD+)
MYNQIINNIHTYYDSGVTRQYEFRKKNLNILGKALEKWEDHLSQALYQDLHKSAAEVYLTEIGFVQAEIKFAVKNLAGWMRPKQVSSPLMTFPSSSKILHDPWGVTLIIAPWNYPLQLLLGPLVAAIAGGNCAVLKPSELAPHTAAALKKMVQDTFDPQYICIVEGEGATVVPQLINENKFDHVFFTGSVPVGKQIAILTASKLIPTVLELGGKSPCIVDKDADLKVAARRICWGKFTNAGQTCVAPDYLLVHESKKDELVALMKQTICEFYTATPKTSPDYGRIITDKRFDKLASYLLQGNIVCGGGHDRQELYIAPTLMDGISAGQPVMKEEIFGPILPIHTFATHDEAIGKINEHPDPLALYLFTTNKQIINRYEGQLSFGGGCVNNTLMHLGNPHLPFGGVGNSGIGSYHGKYGFDTYTRPKAILKTSTFPDPVLKYPPYEKKNRLLKWLLG